ncbi:hypothetical protein E4U61_003721 [Claviceps capensis]|nr:hypothetical protein E4U61_003721 [Claviceps capensis]
MPISLRKEQDKSTSYFQKRTIDKGVEDKYMFKNPGVDGELKEQFKPGEFEYYISQIGLIVRNIFCAQPTRRYAPSTWIENMTSARALVGYATMYDEMLGSNMFIKRDGWLSVEVDVDGENRSIKLQNGML